MRVLPSDDPNYLVLLADTADLACKAAGEQSSSIKGAAVWGDISCVEAEKYETSNGERGFRVRIDEADPNNPDLQRFIGSFLLEAGFPNVEVICEW